MDLIIKNAKLRNSECTHDIGIENGVIAKIEKRITGRAGKQIDAAGCLTVPAFVDPHIHLDKALTITAGRVNKSGGLADRGPRRRGITRVKELLDAGVNVSYGQDVVLDGFSPIFGQCDPLEVGFLMAHAAQLNTFEDIDRLFDMATVNGAKLMRLRDYGLKIGSAATLAVIDCPNIYEAFRLKPKRLYVVKDGTVIAKDEELVAS